MFLLSSPEVSYSAADFRLAEALTVAARQLHEAGGSRAILRTAVRLAVHLVPGTDHAGIVTVGRDQRPQTLASSDEVAQEVQQLADTDAYRALWEQLWSSPVAGIADTTAEDVAGRGLAPLGVRSLLALRLRADRRRLTVLALWSRKPAGLDSTSLRVGRLLAAHISLAHESATVQEQLTEAMRTRDLIGQATGLVMAHHDVDAADAFALLVRASQRENLKLRDLAQRYVDTAAEGSGE
ncbi:ANTAR domain-containing protein [Streptomyces longispororuber]|uniref:ANTAR domain-containing protein n=1 Tax=Streptomyces longispororuber TaxID=68230 RepID=UPI0035AB9695